MNKSIRERIAAQEREAVKKLIADFGSKANLARFLGISFQAVAQWEKNGRVGIEHAKIIQEKTKGEYKSADLRPDPATWFDD